MDEARLNAQAMKAAYQVAQANLEQARWSLAKTRVHAASDGYITNLQTRVGNYASAGVPLVALVDIHSFYVQGYFEETKLRHIAPGKPVEVVLYSGEQRLRGEVESIGRAIHDQSVEGPTTCCWTSNPMCPGCGWPSGCRCGSSCWRCRPG